MTDTYKPYAGIGSRSTPENIRGYMAVLGEYLSKNGYTLRTGGADGADKAFEIGSLKGPTSPEIFIPWRNFNSRYSETDIIYKANREAFELAAKYHPNWDAMSHGGQSLHARNMAQILGENLDSPSQFVLCWTPKGSGKGGTGQVIRVSEALDIPVLDFGKYESLDELKPRLIEFFQSVNIPLPSKK
jgi:hypothetical protein